MTKVAASRPTTIPLQKSRGFSLRQPQKIAIARFWVYHQSHRKHATTTTAVTAAARFVPVTTTGYYRLCPNLYRINCQKVKISNYNLNRKSQEFQSPYLNLVKGFPCKLLLAPKQVFASISALCTSSFLNSGLDADVCLGHGGIMPTCTVFSHKS